MKRNWKKYLALLFAAVLLLCLGLPATAAQVPASQLSATAIGRADHAFYELPATRSGPAAPNISAGAAILVELNSGTVLYGKNIHERLYPASITKVMTTLLAIENIDMNETMTLSHASVTELEDGGFDSRFYEGETFSVKDGLYAFFLESVNTIGHAVAEHLDGSVAAFAERMNRRAAELGAVDTTFRNPHGLNTYWPEHLTSAHDMAKILWAAAENDTFRELAGTNLYTLTDGRGKELLCDHGYQVFNPKSERYDSRAVCGKTGYTNAAGYTRVLYAKEGDMDLIAVVLKEISSDAAYADVKALLDYGFSQFTFADTPAPDMSQLQLPALEQGRLLLTAGKAETYNRGRLLVPKTSAGKSWSCCLKSDADGFRAVMSLDGAELVSYPLSLTLEERPTEAPTEAPTKESEGRSKPEKETKATKSSEISTLSPGGETDPAEKTQMFSLPALILIIALAVLWILALILILLMRRRNQILARKLSRRKRLSGKEKE